MEMLFKDLSYLELWQPLCSVELNQLCNFGRVYHEEQFCEMILNLDHWKEDIMGNIHIKLFEIWTVVQEEMWFKEKVYGRMTHEGRRQTFSSGRLINTITT